MPSTDSDFTPEGIAANASRCGVPDYMVGGLARYILHGISPGSFLTAVLSNDLMEALGRADETNQACLPAYGRFLYNYAPAACKGSPDAVRQWLLQGGIGSRKSASMPSPTQAAILYARPGCNGSLVLETPEGEHFCTVFNADDMGEFWTASDGWAAVNYRVVRASGDSREFGAFV